jgi:tetratricopeptide (TPR) repeat protein
MNRPQDGVSACERATSMNPNSSLSWRLLAAAYIMNDQYPEAIRAADRALALNPDYYQAMLAKSVSYASMQRYGEAKQWAARAKAIHPDESDIADLQGMLRQAQNSKNLKIAGRVGGGILSALWAMVSEMIKAIFSGF